MRFEHGGEDNAMEDDVVFTNEVYQARVGVFPPHFPRIGVQFNGIGYVSDGRIKPYVQYLSFGSFHGYGDTPIQVAAYGTRLQTVVQPGFALSVYIGLPFFVRFQNPLFQPRLVLIQRQVPMGGFSFPALLH